MCMNALNSSNVGLFVSPTLPKHCKQVGVPIADAYKAWQSQENYGEWFDVIGQVSDSSKPLQRISFCDLCLL